MQDLLHRADDDGHCFGLCGLVDHWISQKPGEGTKRKEEWKRKKNSCVGKKKISYEILTSFIPGVGSFFVGDKKSNKLINIACTVTAGEPCCKPSLREKKKLRSSSLMIVQVIVVCAVTVLASYLCLGGTYVWFPAQMS